MAQEHIASGDRAFVDEEFETAVRHYTQALEVEPSAAVYEARANAKIELEKYMEAVQDASKAIELDSNYAKAYLRKGTACFHLEEYETALQCFEQGQQRAPDMPKFRTWIRKCKAELDGELEDVGAAAPMAPAAAPKPAAAAGLTPAAAAGPTPPPQQGLHQQQPHLHQWYQIGSKVVIDVYAKNLPKDAVAVQLTGEDDKLKVTIAAQPAAAGASQQQSNRAAAAGW
ncbi:hypothetical protein COO60DRAFT_1699571 [Scenedesmus sp. NREL 46B-D3]|nr:hypothetical protein COO60DRAFT_1699571 [Scenedesmus sp. NREL 46B-D3]